MLKRCSVMLASITLSLISVAAFAAEGEYVNLFNGKSLDGWVQRGGEAKYRVEDGAIVGQTVANTPNSFLCTKKSYGDFVLEYEYMCDDQLNSGVQFRSTVYDKDTTVKINGKDKKFSAGRVHGYQCEIDPNKPDRMWSGGIYDEGRRGWLYPGQRGGDGKAFTEQGQKTYKKGKWNTVRIACKGDHIQTWLNNEPRADFRDDLTAEGFIALQVHGVGGRKEPLEVRWRQDSNHAAGLNGMMRITLLVPMIVALPALNLFAEDSVTLSQASGNWHQWRGPQANGVTPRGDPPIHWSETKNVRWKIALPGEGSSTPIVWDDRLFLLSAIKTDRPADNPPQADPRAKTSPPSFVYQFAVLCYDRRSGEQLWQTMACQQVPHEGRHATNTYASSSPMTDGERLYVSFGSRGIYCFDLEGHLLWKRDLGNMRTRYGWGEATSPVVHGDLLIVTWDHEDQSFITALNAKTGETRWKVERDEPTSWSTPLVVPHRGRTQVITNGTNRVRSYDLQSGKVIWQCGGQTVNAIPSPILADDFVICMSGYRGAATYAIPLDAVGDITDTDRVFWTHNRGTPYVPSATVVDGRLYFLQGNSGVLHCLDVRTGKRLFGPQRLPGINSVYASPVSASGRVYFVGRDGNAVVIYARDEFQLLAKNKMDEAFDASPAICGNCIYLRSSKSLYCIAAQ